MDMIELKPGFKFVIDKDVNKSEINILFHLINKDRTVVELLTVTGINSTSSIYRTLKGLVKKGIIKSYIEPPETLSRFTII